MILNGNDIDPSNDFLEELFKISNDGILKDWQFEEVCEAFEMEEEHAMMRMLDSTKYRFRRIGEGFEIEEL